MATLIVVGGPAKGSKFALEAHRLVMVGRDRNATFQVVDPRMSRMHLQIRFDPVQKDHHAIDFQSSNGVFINSMKIEAETPLRHGDEIAIGDSIIIYSELDTPDAVRHFEAAHRPGQGQQPTISDTPEFRPG